MSTDCEEWSYAVVEDRSVKTSEDDVPVPPLIKSAALWGTLSH